MSDVRSLKFAVSGLNLSRSAVLKGNMHGQLPSFSNFHSLTNEKPRHIGLMAQSQTDSDASDEEDTIDDDDSREDIISDFPAPLAGEV